MPPQNTNAFKTIDNLFFRWYDFAQSNAFKTGNPFYTIYLLLREHVLQRNLSQLPYEKEIETYEEPQFTILNPGTASSGICRDHSIIGFRHGFSQSLPPLCLYQKGITGSDIVFSENAVFTTAPLLNVPIKYMIRKYTENTLIKENRYGQ